MIESQYFSAHEFDCHDGSEYPSEHHDRLQLLVTTLDAIRAKWGGPIKVVSGYRTPEYNRKVGGAKASQHVEGRAADIKPIGGGPNAVAQLGALVRTMLAGDLLPHLGGLGMYPRWVHIDVRPRPANGHVARWDGGGIGSEPTG